MGGPPCPVPQGVISGSQSAQDRSINVSGGTCSLASFRAAGSETAAEWGAACENCPAGPPDAR